MLEFIRNISPVEILAVALILMLLFGRKLVIGLAKTAGQTFKEIKKISGGVTETLEKNVAPDEAE